MGAGLRAQMDAHIMREGLDLGRGWGVYDADLDRALRLLEEEGRRVVEAGAAKAKSDLAGHLIDVLA